MKLVVDINYGRIRNMWRVLAMAHGCEIPGRPGHAGSSGQAELSNLDRARPRPGGFSQGLERLKLDGNIYLTGFMGAGKSSAGRVMAHHLGRTFVELDDLVERRMGNDHRPGL